jgi:hypothetical protein
MVESWCLEKVGELGRADGTALIWSFYGKE